MDSGSLVFEAFGDIAGSYTSSVYQAAVGTGIPLMGNCNTLPYHAKEILMGSTSYSQTVTLTIPRYGAGLAMLGLLRRRVW
jgi:hypothetical protein